MMASPLRNDGVTIACPRCGQVFAPSGRQRYCSAACRQAVWRQRHPTPLPPLPSRTPRRVSIYECPECSTRYLGEQRCPDCQQFCRRIGPGGLCPHCDEPVALADLIDL
jgi:MYND finger